VHEAFVFLTRADGCMLDGGCQSMSGPETEPLTLQADRALDLLKIRAEREA
jgi:hypothetical protein